ncbi:RagB/SusD family nutrient uptake outer membrane protein [Chitinophaga barathri]|uniref:RagB/SusD family nutrient uptake outer membrane protein n=1 Tax=Chitinophaga barathri TaxID=1647451 RepID=A0A3N4MEY8_9BACT|nr:RagB/SusD family nutrient uptake outer membrane protein [Chitinophaga barathri]RPD40556.1 RagB/SusD family nutrient uptake outer membrane protein [Chitinophaga barathri]
MKRNIIQYTIAGMAALLLSSSCGKSFLDQEIPGRTPLEDYYKTDADVLAATYAAYDFLQAEYNWGWGSPLLVKTFPSDEGNAGGNDPGDQGHYQSLDDFTTDAQNQGVLWVWRVNYFGVYRSNQVINRVKGETDLQKRLVAECKTLRAYYYFELTALWGDVPLVLGDLKPEQYNTTKRTPRAEVYAQLEKDLLEAVAILPVKSALPAAQRFRVSKGTAQALLGKVYLYQQKWAEAAAKFNDVIVSGEYDLEDKFPAAFSKQGEFGVESVFEVPFSSSKKYNWDNFPWDRFRQIESNIHIKLMGPREEPYKAMPGDSLLGGWGFNLPKKKLYDAYVAAGDVERRKNTILSLTELRAGGGEWNATNVWDFEGYWQRKYGSFSTLTTDEGGAVTDLNYGTNTKLIRYADVLLMAAEAYYRSNNEGRARTELNKVRVRAKLGEIQPAGAALFEAIVNERFLELAFEGFRYLDLVRWGRAATELAPLGFRANKNELLPIPNEDVRVGNLEQNQGYN